MKKKLFTFFVFSTILFGQKANSQITTHWVEEFTAPSVQGTLANGYNGWTVASTGGNGADANTWFVSCMEEGHLIGECGTSCPGGAGGNATLHIGSTVIIVDPGAAYFAGGAPFNTMTHKRAESPTIDCSCSGDPVYLKFKYLSGGIVNEDYFELVYYDGLTWTTIINNLQTPLNCIPQGEWDMLDVALPASAVNNPNVKIGFNWINDNNGLGVDPSVAIDSIVVYSQAISFFPNFTWSPSTPCNGDSVTFNSSTSFGPITVWSWDFGGGGSPNTSTLANPTVLFPNDGSFVVTLTGSDNCGTPAVSNSYLVIVSLCVSAVADFSTPNIPICEGDSILFTDLSLGTPTSFEWTFQGGSPSTFSGQAPPYINYSTAGTYDVTLIVTNGFGSDTLYIPNYVTVLNCQLPTAIFSASDTTLCSPDCITFTDASIPSVNITGWNWVFPGGVPAFFIGQFPPLICYNVPGVYDVELTVDDGVNFNTLTKIGYITVSNCTPPTALFNSALTAICTTQCVTFSNLSVLASTWSWSFPGGTPSTFIGQNPPQICYASAGTYDVELIVSNIYGIDTLLLSNYITVSTCVPLAAFSSAVTTGCNGDCFTFSNQSVGASSWDWSFPGGTPSTFSGQNPPPICYALPDTFDVSVIVTNPFGADTLLLTNYIIITYCNLLNAQFTVSDDFICEGDCVSFNSIISAGSPIGWLWKFPGAIPDSNTIQNPPYVCYPNAGVYPVTLIIFDIIGFADTVTYTNYITVNEGTWITTNIDSAAIYGGESIQLIASGGVNYLWTPDNTLNSGVISSPTATPSDTTIYQVEMTDANGCSSSKSIIINVIPPETVWVPSAFTPNNDLRNDVFNLKVSGIILNYTLQIFDRWGEMVFETADPGESWDGSYQSVNLNVGVYVYYYKIEFIDGVVVENSGDVTLLK